MARLTRLFRPLAAVALLLTVAACGRPTLEDAAARTPKLDLVSYFDGKSYAWGQFQDRFGAVRATFRVDIDGSWDGQTLTLDENFVYDDGRTENRLWTLRKTGPDTWSGTAPGVIGTAEGEVSGNAFNWRYEIDLLVADGSTMRVSFDDWLWQLDQDVIFNRAYVSRYGLEIGEVLIFFSRTAPPSAKPTG